jgi:hypothetical protein
MSNSIIEVENLESEGEFMLNYVECIKLDKWKVTISLLISLLTLGGYAVVLMIISTWSNKIYKTLLFSSTDIQSCTHFYVKNKNSNYNIVIK